MKIRSTLSLAFLVLSSLILLNGCGKEGGNPEPEPYSVTIGNRTETPEEGEHIELNLPKQRVVLQLYDRATPETIRRLKDLGVELHQDVPNNAYIATVEAKFYDNLLADLSVRAVLGACANPS